jgi:hypothetical protein
VSFHEEAGARMENPFAYGGAISKHKTMIVKSGPGPGVRRFQVTSCHKFNLEIVDALGGADSMSHGDTFNSVVYWGSCWLETVSAILELGAHFQIGPVAQEGHGAAKSMRHKSRFLFQARWNLLH